MKTMDKRTWMRGVAAVMLVAGSPWALAQTTPDALIKQVSTEVIDAVKADKAIQAGDVAQDHRAGRREGHAACRTSSA
jgi:phospholipid transport system substrate-binding protein